ncbi:aminoglycoside phosphotransferase family protein [Rhodococcus sp. BP-252]|uniref:phosphotransferase family protein n=1 Tax=unclassified Rhodococcus (in: high G+C Gram-positive bacteria) TaxID=192944 RepID=UPI001C9B19AB|nr:MULTISPECIES: aminoglycoside phosphotransferase family protein [unclassified Rhodococcus (in: high G+C Gram-positive bacteria)]MBY6413897.1 aminoglycoside phosphotransferase family protein [Rhodococcus sp. BP-320]MBY6418653.1 aminoglycoside phosphotransferase family protein [Rhodococcus sp. BP-321]MBY6422948.1 aminoglycoside phosphotransferase family protein [Rhodococcus sp. BP-324]MBY6428703.1 aminoglycoside phosphotransferase family protein [Rhodococcus sp. BP-323]MBY6433774.1 aminoglycos
MSEVEVVVAHRQRATLRVGEVFLKIDADQSKTDIEVTAMRLAPIRTAQILWRTPPVLALEALQGRPLGHLGKPSSMPPSAWTAAGSAIRQLHNAPLPPWLGRSLDEIAVELNRECEWLNRTGLVAHSVVAANRRIAEAVLRPWTPVFTHGDLQASHVFSDNVEVTGVIDWSEAAQGDPMYDIATLTLGHPEHLDDVVTGYGTDVDRDVIRGWWSLRCLRGVRWLAAHGFDPGAPGCEIDILSRQAMSI